MSRSDALRNRQRVLDAAIEAYADDGPSFGMHDVARRASVGVGTVYRHFADREELIDAIARPFFDETLVIAHTALAETAPGDRFATFVRAFATALAEHGVSGHCSWDSPAAQPVRAELRTLVTGFVEDGRAAGTIRADLTREDASAILFTTTMLVDATREHGPGIWRRLVELMLDGIRPGPPQEIAAPPVDRSDWDAFVRARGQRAADRPR
jgi:AcrR family transcriptional regulator